ncbi:MAG: sugar transferase [Candidatus Magnetominusculus sp. LBB02]|nr:sugar transferase [Candidatus Magnetominusculus sp. LBB02]
MRNVALHDSVETSKVLSDVIRKFFFALAMSSFSTIVIIYCSFLYETRAISSRRLTAIWGVCVIICTGIVAIRLIIAKVFAKSRTGVRNLLIFGTNEKALHLAERLTDKNSEHRYNLLGFIDNQWSNIEAAADSGHPILTDIAGFRDFLIDHEVDEVVICLPMKSFYEVSSGIAALCEDQGITVRILSDFFNLSLARSKTAHFENEMAAIISTGNMDGLAKYVKRTFDIAVSLIGIIIVSPVLALSAIAIKLTSKGPVLFAQDRIGVNKRVFKMLKLRTMVPNAEALQKSIEALNEVDGPVFKIKNDPRITSVGRFLRKTSIDELPQLFNVLLGDMSLVGPRPLPVRDIRGFDKDWQHSGYWHQRRFKVTPGITCLWQISGRNNISFDKWMELDLYYIDNWSLWLDFVILLKTIPVVLKRTGAS